MNKFFVSYFYTTQEDNQGFGKNIVETTAKKFSSMLLGEIEQKIKRQDNFKQVIILNFIKI